jgi:hypothetical protein
MLGLLGLRIGEACSFDMEDMGTERGHRTLHVIGKGNRPALIPLPVPVARTLDLAAQTLDRPPATTARGATWTAMPTTSLPRSSPELPDPRWSNELPAAHQYPAGIGSLWPGVC